MNKVNSILQSIWGYFLRIILIELGLSFLVIVLLLLIERALQLFADWIFWAGMIFLVLTLFGFLGNLGITRSGLYQLGQSVSGDSASDRVQAELKEEATSFALMPIGLGVAIFAVIISVILEAIF